LCGDYALQAKFNIKGNVDELCAYIARSSEFRIEGNAGARLGKDAYGSTITIAGEAGEESGEGAKATTFKTPNRKTLDLLVKNVQKGKDRYGRPCSGNEIIFIHEDGTEETVRNYGKR
jgi:formylmethanofuran dehydrogenase subunit C